MHHEHSASLNPMCALRAEFVFHTFHLFANLRGREGEEYPTPTWHSEDNPTVLTKRRTRAQCTRVMTGTHLSSGLFV